MSMQRLLTNGRLLPSSSRRFMSTNSQPAFMDWCLKNGIVAPDIKIAHSTRAADSRGLFLSEKSPRTYATGDILAAIPMDLVLCYDTIKKDALYGELIEPLWSFNWDPEVLKQIPNRDVVDYIINICCISTYITLTFDIPDHKMKPYYDVLPAKGIPNSVYLTPAHLQKKLNGIKDLDAEDRLLTDQQFFDLFIKMCHDSDVALDRDRFRWACSMVMSRCTSRQRVHGDFEDIFMVPLFDMANHGSLFSKKRQKQANISGGFPFEQYPEQAEEMNLVAGVPEDKKSQKYFHIHPIQDVTPGAELLLDYTGGQFKETAKGIKSDFLLSYGFIPK